MVRLFLILLITFTLCSRYCVAAVPFDASQFSNPDQLVSASTANLLVKSTGMLTDHRAYIGARSLGEFIGLDVGIEVTLVKIPNELGPALQSAGLTAELPPSAPVPRLVVQKSIGKNVNVGLSWIKYQSYQVYGGHLQVVLIQPEEALTWALRLNYATATLGIVSASTWKPEVVTSFKRGIAETYALMGVQIMNGTVSVPVGGVTASGKGNAINFLSALGVSFFFGPTGIKLGIEIGYTPSGSHIGTKVGFEL